MSIELTLSVPAFDRRRFIRAGLSVAALPAASLSLIPAGPAAATWGTEIVRDWTIDDQWNAYPRYNEAIGFGRPKPASRPNIDPADEFLVQF
jgi:hypothetical protein